MSTEAATDWIYPGAEVVIYRDDHSREGAMSYNVTKVVRVAAQSFTVEDREDRFKLADLATKSMGGTWSSFRYRAVPVGSEKHCELSAVRRREGTKNRARTATQDWMNKRDDLAAITAVIETFAALRDELSRP